MHTYARVVNGVVMEIILPATDQNGNEVPIAGRFTPDLVAEMIDVTSVIPAPECWWTTTDGGKTFKAPT